MSEDRRQYWAVLLLQMFSALVLCGSALVWPGPWTWTRWLGFVLLVVGMMLVLTARVQLSTSFSITPQARRLVTHGIYAKIRNPIYVFGVLVIAGIFLIIRARWAWLVLALLVVMQVVRAHREAAVLEAKFGDEYRAYRQKTWF
jgi:protein-S-isoprenylcysteine O-methyltransferase Ste14